MARAVALGFRVKCQTRIAGAFGSTLEESWRAEDETAARMVLSR